MDLLAFQTYLALRDACQDESHWSRSARHREGAPSAHRCQRASRAVWRRREGRVVIGSDSVLFNPSVFTVLRYVYYAPHFTYILMPGFLLVFLAIPYTHITLHSQLSL